MSDKNDKPGATPLGAGQKPESNERAGQGGIAPEADGDSEHDLARIAPQLRGLYQELLKEPIPDRFTKLLDELERKESGGQ